MHACSFGTSLAVHLLQDFESTASDCRRLTLMILMTRDAMESSVTRHLQVYGNDSNFEPIGYPNPTFAEPGTREKIEVLRDRLEAGQQLHHPQDVWAKLSNSMSPSRKFETPETASRGVTPSC